MLPQQLPQSENGLRKNPQAIETIGGAEGDRTPDLMTARTASPFFQYPLPAPKSPCFKALENARLHLILPLRWIFLDPPYALEETPVLLEKIEEKAHKIELLESGAWLILEASRRDLRPWRSILQKPFEYFEERIYGESKLHVWRWQKTNEEE